MSECDCEKWLTTADLIEELRRVDPSGKRRVTIYEHPKFLPFRPRDIGTTGLDGEQVIALQYADWTAGCPHGWNASERPQRHGPLRRH